MKQSINISSDSEKTVSDRIVGVEYNHLQADAESKTPIPSSKEERQTLEVVPNIETPSENRTVEDDAPLDVSPVSVYFPSNPNAVRIVGLLSALRKMVTACTKELKEKCKAAAKKKKVQVKMASPEAPSQIPGELIDASPIRFKRPDNDNITPMPPRNRPGHEAVLLPIPQNVIVPALPLKNPEEPSSSDNRTTEKKRRNHNRFEPMKVDFVLPSHVDTSGLDLDNLVSSPIDEAQLNRARRSTRQFSFTERLLQWELEVRERPEDGKFDMYFYHGKGGSFRSIAEVTRFMMYEEYPGGKPRTGNKRNSRSGQFEVISL